MNQNNQNKVGATTSEEMKLKPAAPVAPAAEEKAPEDKSAAKAEPSKVDEKVYPKALSDKSYSGILELTEGHKSPDVTRVRDKLLKQEIVSFMIPLGIGEKKGAFEHVQINGWKAQVMKGDMVQIPRQVAKMLMAYLNISEGKNIVLPHGRIDRDEATSNALL
jgi:hypothetical protein